MWQKILIDLLYKVLGSILTWGVSLAKKTKTKISAKSESKKGSERYDNAKTTEDRNSAADNMP